MAGHCASGKPADLVPDTSVRLQSLLSQGCDSLKDSDDVDISRCDTVYRDSACSTRGDYLDGCAQVVVARHTGVSVSWGVHKRELGLPRVVRVMSFARLLDSASSTAHVS